MNTRSDAEMQAVAQYESVCALVVLDEQRSEAVPSYLAQSAWQCATEHLAAWDTSNADELAALRAAALPCTCPHCDAQVSLTDFPDFYDLRPDLQPGKTASDVMVYCPECLGGFLVDIR